MARGTNTNRNGVALGFEEQLWKAADLLRGHMDAAEYKHVVLGLIFLKYISDAFEQHHAAGAKGGTQSRRRAAAAGADSRPSCTCRPSPGASR
jgi:type I restriction-modification system DNA methylase subunit